LQQVLLDHQLEGLLQAVERGLVLRPLGSCPLEPEAGLAEEVVEPAIPLGFTGLGPHVQAQLVQSLGSRLGEFVG